MPHADEERRDAHEPALNMLVVVGATVRRDDQILFVRQRAGALTGHWYLPTGLVEPAEAPEMAAMRETQEEAGITAIARGVLALSNIAWRGQRQLYIVFLCDHVAGEPVPDGHETDRAAYLSLAQIDTIGEPLVPLAALLARRVATNNHHVLYASDIGPLGPCMERHSCSGSKRHTWQSRPVTQRPAIRKGCPG
ncbi:MAG TPA: NUDIX domain-containing protein [Herpetosiphonaceae bacterium]|nr:NUDIX domain-containing protein [Herpetosiphonaceae bacterium]